MSSQIISRTIYGAKLQTASLLGLPYVADPNSTLNEAFDLFKNEPRPNDAYPYMTYYCIGFGGHRPEVGANSIPYMAPIKHRTRDANTFEPIPFLIRPVDEDLTSAQRDNYGMRVRKTINGDEFFCYYLKKIDLSTVEPEMIQTIKDGQTITNTPFAPEVTDLTPTPPAVDPGQSTTTTGEFFSVAATIDIAFSDADVAELREVAEVMFSDSNMAIISEVGLVTAHPKTVTGENASGDLTVNYVEALDAQISNHITAYYPVGYSQRGFDLRLDAGATQAAYGDMDTSSGP